MDTISRIQGIVVDAINAVYNTPVDRSQLMIQPTKSEFEGDYTLVTFPLSKMLRKSPEAVAGELGAWLTGNVDSIESFSVVKGFLNLSFSGIFWNDLLLAMSSGAGWWKPEITGEKVLVEYSSPNTNKPLHLGHVRNILLGWSMSRIFEEMGNEVVRVQIVNDRGIAICKSMLAWKMWSGGQTPEQAETKPDHFVGDWYVRFEQEFAREYSAWQQTEEAQKLAQQHTVDETDSVFFKNFKNRYFNEYSELGASARQMLREWESGSQETRDLWKQMNSWVYEGFEETYERLGVAFDKLYFESDTYLLGKEMVAQGLDQGLFYKKEDGSVWVDLTDNGLDERILLRSDGTSVYLTQDLGTAQLRYRDFGAERMIYVVADEQNYHFDSLFQTLKLLGEPYADGLHHLSYGMVELPSGRMKTREGKVVDADDLMDEVYHEAEKAAIERGELASVSESEQQEILRKISMGALKYFIIKVEPRRRMIFNPEESVDLQGQTGPYIQNAYVRIQSILRKAAEMPSRQAGAYTMVAAERELMVMLESYGTVIKQAADQYNPGTLANYCYTLAKTFHRYYHDYRILNAESEPAADVRLKLISQIAVVLKSAMELLGIEMPERM